MLLVSCLQPVAFHEHVGCFNLMQETRQLSIHACMQGNGFATGCYCSLSDHACNDKGLVISQSAALSHVLQSPLACLYLHLVAEDFAACYTMQV